jgi:hypothetical protein
VDVTFFFSAKKKVTKEKTLGCALFYESLCLALPVVAEQDKADLGAGYVGFGGRAKKRARRTEQ